MTPKLSILICSLQSRAASLATLLNILRPQLTPLVEVLTDVDNREASIGQKRNRLLARAAGEYVCFIDDDDRVPDNYVRLILEALESGPDCVGFNLMYFVNNSHRGDAIHSLRYERYGQRRGPRSWMTIYERTPNHLNPIRREIAQQVGFPDLSRGEDTDFAERVRPLLKTEVFIDQVLYRYFYRSRK